MTRDNKKVRNFIVKSLLRINQNEPDILASFQNQLYDLGQMIKQRDEELFDEIIRTWTDEYSGEKIKVELNRNRRQ